MRPFFLNDLRTLIQSHTVMLKRITYTLLSILLLSACDGIGDFPSDWSDGKYKVSNENGQRVLLKERNNHSLLTIIQPNVTAVGSNQCLIVVKQKEINSGQINYFIITKEEAVNCPQETYKKGALTKISFH